MSPNYFNHQNFFLKGSASGFKRLSRVNDTHIPLVVKIIKNHKFFDDFDFYVCGSVVEGYESNDLDVVVAGEFNHDKLFLVLTELTQQVLDEVGIELDIIYHTDIRWMDGGEYTFKGYYAYNMLIEFKDNEVIRNRAYRDEKEGLLLYRDFVMPTKKSLKRNYTRKNIQKIV